MLDPAIEPQAKNTIPATPHAAVKFIEQGYEVRPCLNGGFVVLMGSDYQQRGFIREMAAFSNYPDMAAWLQKGADEKHGVFRVSYYPSHPMGLFKDRDTGRVFEARV